MRLMVTLRAGNAHEHFCGEDIFVHVLVGNEGGYGTVLVKLWAS